MDPNLESFYHIDSALSLAVLAMACTQEDPRARPSMAEIIFSLSILIQSSFEIWEGSRVCSDLVIHGLPDESHADEVPRIFIDDCASSSIEG
ncbi:hypothetical protein V6N12_022059 [Hibiscus sabdariffa]|uniref:Uncharacterized protein n=1 Tax=Hibiscus sabdariffa TaxID=183260 RepID=A0ABR2FTU8_9ROSI